MEAFLIVTPSPTQTFTYDPVGNRTSSHLSLLHRYDGANRLLEDDAFLYRYDANGNLIDKRPTTCPRKHRSRPKS